MNTNFVMPHYPNTFEKRSTALSRIIRSFLASASLLLILVSTVHAGPTHIDQMPAISIIIDDMGNHKQRGAAAISLPGKITYAFLPHTTYAGELAQEVHAQGKEVMLHLPMQSHDGVALGPGALTLHMTEQAFNKTLDEAIRSIPYTAGINNHMGSLLTRHPGAMTWLMQRMGRHGNLFFLDSRTTEHTLGEQIAHEYKIPNTRRDVFLDNNRDPEAIRGQFRLLVNKARQKGFAIAIGHPYPTTIAVLESALKRLGKLGLRLIPVSEMIKLQQKRQQWPESSPSSLRTAKNSKPSTSSTCCAERASR